MGGINRLIQTNTNTAVTQEVENRHHPKMRKYDQVIRQKEANQGTKRSDSYKYKPCSNLGVVQLTVPIDAVFQRSRTE
jgi:hypothetical protein